MSSVQVFLSQKKKITREKNVIAVGRKMPTTFLCVSFPSCFVLCSSVEGGYDGSLEVLCETCWEKNGKKKKREDEEWANSPTRLSESRREKQEIALFFSSLYAMMSRSYSSETWTSCSSSFSSPWNSFVSRYENRSMIKQKYRSAAKDLLFQKRVRTKSENDASKRSSVDDEEKVRDLPRYHRYSGRKSEHTDLISARCCFPSYWRWFFSFCSSHNRTATICWKTDELGPGFFFFLSIDRICSSTPKAPETNG